MEQVFVRPVQWQLGSHTRQEHAIWVRWEVPDLLKERFVHNKTEQDDRPNYSGNKTMKIRVFGGVPPVDSWSYQHQWRPKPHAFFLSSLQIQQHTEPPKGIWMVTGTAVRTLYLDQLRWHKQRVDNKLRRYTSIADRLNFRRQHSKVRNLLPNPMTSGDIFNFVLPCIIV